MQSHRKKIATWWITLAHSFCCLSPDPASSLKRSYGRQDCSSKSYQVSQRFLLI